MVSQRLLTWQPRAVTLHNSNLSHVSCDCISFCLFMTSKLKMYTWTHAAPHDTYHITAEVSKPVSFVTQACDVLQAFCARYSFTTAPPVDAVRIEKPSMIHSATPHWQTFSILGYKAKWHNENIMGKKPHQTQPFSKPTSYRNNTRH